MVRAHLRRTAAVLRITAIRWLIAFVSPPGLTACAVLTWFWPGFALIGLGGFGLIGIPLTGAYLIKVEGAHLAWLIPLVAFFLPYYFLIFAIPSAILAHSGHRVTAVVAHGSFRGTDLFTPRSATPNCPAGLLSPAQTTIRSLDVTSVRARWLSSWICVARSRPCSPASRIGG